MGYAIVFLNDSFAYYHSPCTKEIVAKASFRKCALVLHLIVWDCQRDPKFAYPRYRASCC